MKIRFLLLLACLVSSLKAQADDHAWSRVAKPTSGHRVESIGKYTSGCLRGAATLPQNGKGYQVMRLSRKRFYGHPELIKFIQNLGQFTHNQNLGSLLVGDLGMARGGPTLTGHRSHQTGLDVDIWYLLAKDAEKKELNISERESLGAPSVLTTKADGINSTQWSQANEQVLEAAARSPEVDRIFVNAYVKQVLCNHKSNLDWLQKIRPWYAHADHFHVRLKCPVGNLNCEKQEPVPLGDGCGADLAWWFSAEARLPSKKPPPQKIPLPKECVAVLNEN